MRDGSNVFEGSRLQQRDKVPGFVDIVVEVPKGSFVKRLPDGAVDYVGPLPSPFNYGSVPAIPAPDGNGLVHYISPKLPVRISATMSQFAEQNIINSGFV